MEMRCFLEEFAQVEFFTRPPVVTVVTNFKYVDKETDKEGEEEVDEEADRVLEK